jgi:hypothetical protein
VTVPSRRLPDPPALSRLRALINRCYPLHRGLAGLVLRVAAFTLLTMLVLLGLFLLKRPAALQPNMWLQFAMQGFPVAFLVNLAGGAFHAEYFDELSRRSGVARSLLIFIGELAVRALLFVMLTATSLMAWAMVFDAFGGDRSIALASVVSTLAYGLRFDGLAGVYIYACVVAAFPFLALFGIRVTAARPGAT